MTIYIGSARHDENGKYKNGKAGDQLQTNTLDTVGEVSAQTLASFVGTRKWYVLRPTNVSDANALAKAMKTAVNNKNIGYDQNNRLSIMTYGVDSKTATECDCSSLVRACIKKAIGLSVSNFTTANEKTVLLATGKFENVGAYKSGLTIYEGDIFVTQSKGHTGICIQGNARASVSYYPKYAGTSSSIVTALKSVGETDTSLAHRKVIAKANGITSYSGTAEQNLSLVKLLKVGKLIKA